MIWSLYAAQVNKAKDFLLYSPDKCQVDTSKSNDTIGLHSSSNTIGSIGLNALENR